MMRWLFMTPRRLYGSMAGAGALALVLAVLLIGLRVSSLSGVAPRSDVATPPAVIDVADPAMDAVRDKGHGEPVRAVVQARDGLVQVVDVRMSTGEVGEVVLVADVVDGVTWRSR